MECWFDLERHLDAEIIGLRVGVHEIGPVLKKIVTNSRTGKTRKLSTTTFIFTQELGGTVGQNEEVRRRRSTIVIRPLSRHPMH